MPARPTNPIDVVRALFAAVGNGPDRRSDLQHVDQLMSVEFVNHAAGPKGRDGWKSTIETIEHDLGPIEVEHHHLVSDGAFVAHHMTLHGVHRSSTMPLLAGRAPTHRRVSWRFMHLWRVSNLQIVEHWACRDDLSLLRQIEATD